MNVHAAALAKAHRFDEQTSAFAHDVIEGLSQQPKRLSPKYFYDAAGSELFEQITRAAGILSDPHRARDPARAGRRDRFDHPRGRSPGGIRRRRHHQGPPAARSNARSAPTSPWISPAISSRPRPTPCAGIFRSSTSIRSPRISPRRSPCPTRSGRCRRSDFSRDRRSAISSRMRPAPSCAALAKFSGPARRW